MCCGALRADDEYFNPEQIELQMIVAEGILGCPPDASFPFGYDDLAIAASRIRGTGAQHEYLVTVKQVAWNDDKQSVLEQWREILSRDAWDGARLSRRDDHQ